jgi:hypothetical protein
MTAGAVAIGSVFAALMTNTIGPLGAGLVLLVLVALSTVIVSFGATAGVDIPRFAAYAFRASAIGAIGVSSAFGALAIWLVSLVKISIGASASPYIGEIGGATVAAIAAVIDPKGMLTRWMPAKVSARIVQRRYGVFFQTLDSADQTRGDAYRALNWDVLGDGRGDLVGWGRDATERRLILINKGLKDLGV